MPVDKQVLLRYKVLNRCFRNQFREFTIDDLVDECNAALRKADKPDVSKRTIQNDINTLEADYGIMLNENLKRGRQRLYRYSDTTYTLPLFRMNDKERNKIQDAIRVLEDFEGDPMYEWARSLLIQVGAGLFDEDTSSVVSFQSNPDLEGLVHFSKLLQAILTKRVLRLTYKPFGKDTLTDRIYPYHLKQFNDRWYLIAQAIGYDNLAHYALDRIDSFEEMALPYKEPEMDFNHYFDDVIGVTVPERYEPVDVILRVANNRFNYIKTKPLHLSQRIISEEPGFTKISINVKINNELISLILSFGPDVEVIAPASLRKMIANSVSAMSYHYPEDK